MKNILKYAFYTLSAAFLWSCVDEDKIRYEFDDFEKVVNMRIESSVGSFDATNAESQTVLTFYSEDNSVVDEVELMLEYYIFLSDSIAPRVSFMTIPGGNIKNDGSTKFTITLAEMTEALGITPDDLAGGDILTFYNITHLTNGKVYPDTVLKGTDFEGINISPTITQSSSTTSFTTSLAYPIVCALPEGFATGQYQFEQIVPLNPAMLGVTQPWDGEVVTVTATSNTTRTFTARQYLTAFGGFNTPFTIDLACNVVLVARQPFPVGCGDNITIVQDVANIGTFDITDDSVITIGIIHEGNACGAPAPTTIRLTKL